MAVEFDELLRRHFPVLDIHAPEMETFGFRALPFYGDLVRNGGSPDFIEHIKKVLPSDAAIYAIDGLLYRMRPSTYGHAVDQYCIAFGSSEWEHLPSGSEFPVLSISWHNEAPFNCEYPKRVELHSIYAPGVYEFVIDKTTQVVEIPRDRETEDRMIIVVKSKE